MVNKIIGRQGKVQNQTKCFVAFSTHNKEDMIPGKIKWCWNSYINWSDIFLKIQHIISSDMKLIIFLCEAPFCFVMEHRDIGKINLTGVEDLKIQHRRKLMVLQMNEPPFTLLANHHLAKACFGKFDLLGKAFV